MPPRKELSLRRFRRRLRWRRRCQGYFLHQLQPGPAHQLRYRCRIQPRRIVLHQQRASRPVKREPSNPVNLASIRQSKQLRLTRLPLVAKHNLNRCHSPIIPSSTARRSLSQRLNHLPDLRVFPIRRPNKPPPNPALPVDQKALRPPRRPVLVCRRLRGIANRLEIHMPLRQKPPISRFILIDTHRNDRNLRMSVVELQQRRQLLHTRGTPACPEIQQHRLSAIACQPHRIGIIGNSKVRRRFADLGGMTAPVTTRPGNRSAKQHRPSQPSSKTIQPHVPIIRSGSPTHNVRRPE